MIAKILNIHDACGTSADCIQSSFQQTPFLKQMEIVRALYAFPAGPLRKKALKDINKRNHETNGTMTCVVM